MILTMWNEFEKNEGNTIAANIPSDQIIIAILVKITIFKCKANSITN